VSFIFVLYLSFRAGWAEKLMRHTIGVREKLDSQMVDVSPKYCFKIFRKLRYSRAFQPFFDYVPLKFLITK